jgi:NADH dehydrogenase [ubiquinone] 1 alpha subcomplex assembly factor 7
LSALEAVLTEEIRRSGPLSVARFMTLALQHPRHGYYRRGIPLGAGGDFVTAPEISQAFGEVIGAWLAQAWVDFGRPAPARLVELGPGRGTLMADLLRATRTVAGFHGSVRLHLVETSGPL